MFSLRVQLCKVWRHSAAWQALDSHSSIYDGNKWLGSRRGIASIVAFVLQPRHIASWFSSIFQTKESIQENETSVHHAATHLCSHCVFLKLAHGKEKLPLLHNYVANCHFKMLTFLSPPTWILPWKTFTTLGDTEMIWTLSGPAAFPSLTKILVYFTFST